MDSRRTFLGKFAISLGAPIALASRTFGQDPPAEKIKEDDPVAMALGYKEDATKVDPIKYPQYKEGDICEGCALMPNLPEGDYAPCAVFANKLANKKGWCATFAKKPAQ